MGSHRPHAAHRPAGGVGCAVDWRSEDLGIEASNPMKPGDLSTLLRNGAVLRTRLGLPLEDPVRREHRIGHQYQAAWTAGSDGPPSALQAFQQVPLKRPVLGSNRVVAP